MAGGPRLEVRLLNGEAVPVSCEDCVHVGHLRQRVSEALNAPAARVRLLLGPEALRDAQLLPSLPSAEGLVALTVVVVKQSPVLTGHGDGIIRRWDLSAETYGACVQPTDSMQGHGGAILALSADWLLGHVLSGSADWTLRVWGLRPTGKGLDCLGVLCGHGAPVHAVCADFAVGRGLSGSEDGTARLWNIRDMFCLAIFEGHHRRPVHAVGMALGAAARWALSAGRDARLHVWDLTTRQLYGHLDGHGNAVLALCVDKDGERALSGSKDRRLRVWDIQAMACQAALEGHEGPVVAVVADFEVRRALSASEDATLRLWDLSSLTCLSVLADWRGSLATLSVGHGLQRAVSGGVDGAVTLWDMGGGGRRLATIEGNADMGCAYAVSIDDSQ